MIGSTALPVAAGVLWLEQAMLADPGRACPPLAGAERADVCVVGGGFTGLWTALEVTDRHPEARVVLVEAMGCGYGASGRNGGWATGWYDELDDLVDHFGADQALWLADQSHLAIERIGAFAAEHGIDGAYRQRGALWAAAARAQLGAWHAAIAACRANGVAGMLETLDRDEVVRRTGSPVLLGAARHTDAAAVQPALLVRGMRRVALERGVRIHEGTPMVALGRGAPAVVQTPAGYVEADQVVLALNAWSGMIRELRRSFVVVGSHLVATEPLGDAVTALPWSAGELLGDAQLSVHYAQVSADGRIVFGRGLGAIGPAGRVTARHWHDPRVAATVAADLRRWFPQFAGVRITHAWGGPVDRAPGHLPFAGTLGDHGNIHYGLGYSGNGVAPSALLGRILGRLATGANDAYTRCALVGGPPAYLPPEPLRTVGGTLVKAAVQRAERIEMSGGTPDPVSRAAKRLVSFRMPAALEPRSRGGARRLEQGTNGATGGPRRF